MDMRDAIKTVREIRSPHAMNSRQVAFLMRMANGHDGALYESEGSV
jgi:hypothetical protein